MNAAEHPTVNEETAVLIVTPGPTAALFSRRQAVNLLLEASTIPHNEDRAKGRGQLKSLTMS